MNIVQVNPQVMGPAPAAYSNGVRVLGAQETIYISGQIGIDAEGVAHKDFSGQAVQIWANITAILADADMTIENIVKTTVFLVDPADYPTFVSIRKDVLKGHKPASTLVYVSGLVKPEWKVEVEVIAAK